MVEMVQNFGDSAEKPKKMPLDKLIDPSSIYRRIDT